MFKRLICALALLVPVAAFAAAPAAKPAAKPAAPAKAEAPAPAPTASPKVLLHTSMGDITLELYESGELERLVQDTRKA